MSVDNKNTFSPKRTSQRGEPVLSPAEGVSPARKPRRVPSEEARRSRKRLNALLHGITSNSPVIPGMENEAAWQRHCDGIVASIEPVGGLEEFFAQRLASLLWRLNRVVRYEVAATMLSIEGTAEAVIAAENYLAGTNLAEGGIIVPEPEIVEEQRELRILPPDHHLDRITRQERHFHRQALQTLHEIEALQARRKGHPVNLARVDFSGSPAA
ncbi:MAG: hypothetical protein IIC90_08210 [Chloroflexi bacterium]|nr:hypothetical protein [Chloroflexota bacterium]